MQDYDKQLEQRQIRCPVCNSDNVRKVPAATHIQAAPAPRSERQQEAHRVLMELAEQVARHSEDVGRQFAEEARKIHYQETPARSIRGMASPDEVRELLDEGIPVLPLPGKPTDLH